MCRRCYRALRCARAGHLPSSLSASPCRVLVLAVVLAGANSLVSGLRVKGRLSLYGLRRGEVLGLRWSDIDLTARTLTVSQARLLVEYKVRLEEPKSRNGRRTLPLDDALTEALIALRKRQLNDSAAQALPIRLDLPTSIGTGAAST